MKQLLIIFLFCGTFLHCREEEIPILENDDDLEIPVEEKDTIPIIDTVSVRFDTLNFLALGDSYTIGQGVSIEDRWPVQLAKQAEDLGNYVFETQIIARTGWTTGDLKSAIFSTAFEHETYDYVSLLIGVNDQYRGYDIEKYPGAFEELLKIAIQKAGGRQDRVFVLSIPDYGVTPFGSSNAAFISQEIDKYNAINLAVATTYQVQYFDITGISRLAATNHNLLADDRLHPSGLMYQQWVELILHWLESQLG